MIPVLRCAVYARFSSEKQSPLSVVLVDDTSRISRTLKDSFTIHDELRFADIRLVFVSQGIDTDSEQAEVLLATHGIVDSLYLKELGKKVHRGVEGKALSGLHTGGRCFGYRNVPIEDSTRVDQHGRALITGVRLEVREDQAAIVRRIFQMYAEGNSLQRITKQLNAEGVVSPQPQKGRISRSWCPSSIRTILRNERFRGRVIWGKTIKVRSKSGKRIYKRTTADKWVVREIPEQRIVSEELWNSVQARIEMVKQVYGEIGRKGGMQGRSVSSPYVFSGLLKCSQCGANISIVSGRWRGRSDVVYGCPQNAFRGASVCTNSVRVFRKALEERLLGGLQAQIMRPEAVEYVLERFEAELVKALDNLGGDLEQMRRRKEALEREVANLANVVAQGDFSPALRAALVDRERQIGQITGKLLESRPDSLPTKLRNIRGFVTARMQNLRAIMNSNTAQVRAELAKHIEKITLTPSGQCYIASGLEFRRAWQYRWCRGPESNWLRPPFQGGALPLSYPGTLLLLV